MFETQRARIALIDDDTALLELLRDLLETIEGHEVLICKNADHAHSFVKEHRPDLVLLDIRMGGKEIGWAILEQLTVDPETRLIPVIVCSAIVGELRDREPLLRRDGVAVLAKPFDVDTLLERVDERLARNSADGGDRATSPA